MLTEKKRKLYLFAISILMNLLFFLAAYFLKLPVWLDTTGTIYISVLLFFPAGFVVGLINNTILSLFFFGFNSISYYIISAAVAFTAGICAKKCKKHRMKFLILLSSSIFFVSILLAVPLTFIVDKGIPSDFWGNRLYFQFIDMGMAGYLSTILSVSIVKFIDVIISIALVVLIYILTPLKLKKGDNIVSQKVGES